MSDKLIDLICALRGQVAIAKSSPSFVKKQKPYYHFDYDFRNVSTEGVTELTMKAGDAILDLMKQVYNLETQLGIADYEIQGLKIDLECCEEQVEKYEKTNNNA